MQILSLTFYLAIAALFGSVGSVSASDLLPCPKYRHPTNSPWHNCVGTFPQEWLTGGPTGVSGDKYVGEFKHNKGHGQGTFTFGQFRILQDLNMLGSGSEESGTVRAVSPTQMETNMSVNLKTM